MGHVHPFSSIFIHVHPFSIAMLKSLAGTKMSCMFPADFPGEIARDFEAKTQLLGGGLVKDVGHDDRGPKEISGKLT